MEDPTPTTVMEQPSSSAVENNGEVESNMQKKTTTTKKMSKMVKARRELSPLRDKMALFEGDGGAKQIDEAARKKSSERARSVSPVPQRLKGDALSPFVATANNKQKLSNGNGNRNNLSPTRSKLNTTDALLDSPFDNNNKGDDNMSQDNGQPTDSIEPPLGMEKEVGNDDEYVAVVSLDDKEEEEEQQQLVSEEIKEEEEVEEVEHVAAMMDRQNSEEEEDVVEIDDVAVVEGSSQPPVVGEEVIIKRIPKRSAILARDSPERDIYIQQRIQQKLETWNNNKDTKWHIRQYTFDGYSISETKVEEHITIKLSSLEDTIETFYKDPEKYIAMYYNKEIVNGATPNDDVSFTVTFVVRAGTTGYKPDDLRTDNTGRFVIYQHVYKRLPSMKDDILPLEYRDEYTDKMTYLGKFLHTTNVDEKNDNNDDGCTTIIVNNNKPIMPGRGMGIADTANMKLFGDDGASPNDIFQGDVIGDCWLLSAIACLADFDFAVKRLFRKTTTADLGNLPQDEPNQYTITLWDLNTWNEVDIVVDERLPVRGDGSGFLLGAKPSHEGLLWVPYLEKAIAIHCGGYDKLEGKEIVGMDPHARRSRFHRFADSSFPGPVTSVGGSCTNAWPMMTGSRNQFIVSKNPDTSLYRCMARYNAKEKKWTDHSNSPHDSDQNVWSVDWPKVGGGGIMGSEITAEDLYNRIVAWDKTNYLIGAGTDGWSDKESTDGIVDNHAYSVIDSQRNICGTGIDLLLIRNPWGKGGELQNGKFYH